MCIFNEKWIIGTNRKQWRPTGKPSQNVQMRDASRWVWGSGYYISPEAVYKGSHVIPKPKHKAMKWIINAKEGAGLKQQAPGKEFTAMLPIVGDRVG